MERRGQKRPFFCQTSMFEMKYPHLFEPIKLGNVLFRNRLFSAPQDYPGLTAENFLTPEATAFYETKAQGGFASVCIGDCVVDSKFGHAHKFMMRGDDIRSRVSLARTAQAIIRHGAVANIELAHAGKFAGQSGMEQGFMYGPMDEEGRGGIPVRAMDEAYIEHLINCFSDTAAFVKQCGYGMINIHAGHGWMLSQFLSPQNQRKDKWGGSLENRMRFLLCVIEAVRKRVGRNFPIEVRVSADELTDTGYHFDEGLEIFKAIDAQGMVDLLNVSAGHHEVDEASMYSSPTLFMPDGVNVHFAADVKKHVKTPVEAVGALTDPAMMEELLASGQCDVLQLARQTLADPDLPIKAREGRDDEVTECLRCFNCFHNSSLNGVFYCAVNPIIGHETERKTDNTVRRKEKVLVVGGGVGGMQAALTASECGHEVILCEKTDELGGTLRCERHVPFKQKLDRYLDTQARKVQRDPHIEVRMNTEVTPELAREIAPDAIIAATGARPAIPPVPGIDGKNVMGAEEVYHHPEQTGDKVVIMGGGLVGVELGIWLAHSGKDVTVVEMAPQAAGRPADEVADGSAGSRINSFLEFKGDNLVHGVALGVEMSHLPNMRIFVKTRALEVKENGLMVEGPEGTRLIEANTVIYATGQRPQSEAALALKDCAPEFHMLGDCVTPKNIMQATSIAYQVARDLGRV